MTEDDKMHVVIYHPEGPDEGYVLMTRELGDDEILDERAFADRWAEQMDCTIVDPNGDIPDGSGDLCVEFIDGPPNLDRNEGRGYDIYLPPVCIWSSECFYVDCNN